MRHDEHGQVSSEYLLVLLMLFVTIPVLLRGQAIQPLMDIKNIAREMIVHLQLAINLP